MAALMTTLGLEKRTIDERWRLVDELIDSVLGAVEPPPLTGAQRADLDRRLEAFKDDPLAGTPWEEVYARLKGKR
ncbi:MAG: addiction module protein [Gemmataceae bacterium]|nr:addiction module protein [Gemmataceae bacterium]